MAREKCRKKRGLRQRKKRLQLRTIFRLRLLVSQTVQLKRNCGNLFQSLSPENVRHRYAVPFEFHSEMNVLFSRFSGSRSRRNTSADFISRAIRVRVIGDHFPIALVISYMEHGVLWKAARLAFQSRLYSISGSRRPLLVRYHEVDNGALHSARNRIRAHDFAKRLQ